MLNPFRSAIRISAFFRKEVTQVLRQPRLLMSLVFGPFLILLLFGIGYRDEGRTLRTLFLVQKGDPIQQRIQEYAPKLGSAISFQGITNNPEEARTKLRDGAVDLVVVAPAAAEQTLRNNQQAVFKLYHNEIDPYQSDYVRFTGEMYVDKLNHSLFTTAIKTQKKGVGRINSDLKDTIHTVRGFRQALESKNVSNAKKAHDQLRAKADELTESLKSEIDSFAELEDENARKGAQELDSRLERLRENLKSFDALPDEPSAYPPEAARAGELEQQLQLVRSRLEELQKIDTGLLTSPFVSRAIPIAKAQPNLSQYFTPAVIILLLQHLAITFAALSLVREFTTGRAELYRISPARSGEILIGKYAGYLLIGYLVTAALTALLIYGLHMPMKGNWLNYFIVVSVVLITSLGVGFVLSMFSTSEGQAIQYSMIFLLMSIFFTGFLLNLKMLIEPVRFVSWALPATYGIRLMQDVMLRGDSIEPFTIAALAAGGLILFAMASALLRRRWQIT